MQKYVLSIIIPIYNRVDLIHRCVDGIMEQSNKVEIILVDDCSTDNSAEACISLATEYANIVFVQMQQNKGPGAARNEGIKIASGDFLFFLDSDDLINNLNSLIELLNNNPNTDIVCSNMITVRVDGTVYESNHIFYENELMSSDIWFQLNKQRGIHSHLYRTARKNFLLENNILFPELYCAEDGMFTLDVLMAAKLIYATPLQVYRYYQDTPNSLVTFSRSEDNAKRSFFSSMQMINHITALIKVELNSDRREFLERVLDSTIIAAISFINITELKNNDIIKNHIETISMKILNTRHGKNIYLCPGSLFNVEIATIFNEIGHFQIEGFIDNMAKTNATAVRLVNNGHKLYNPSQLANNDVVIILFSPSPVVMDALIMQFSEYGYAKEYYKGIYILFKKG